MRDIAKSISGGGGGGRGKGRVTKPLLTFESQTLAKGVPFSLSLIFFLFSGKWIRRGNWE